MLVDDLKKCGYCGALVAPNAKACPSCGGQWPVTGRSNFRLSVERLHAFITVIGWVEPKFEATPQTYLSMIMEMIAAIIGFAVFIGFNLALVSFLTILFTEGKSGFRSIHSASDFFSYGMSGFLWIIGAFLVLVTSLIIFAHAKLRLKKYKSGGR